MTYSWGKTYDPVDHSLTSHPNHKCPTCGVPIYDHRPVCIVCYKAGKFPQYLWKKSEGLLTPKKMADEYMKLGFSLRRLKKYYHLLKKERKPLLRRLLQEKIKEEQLFYQSLSSKLPLNPENRGLKVDGGYGNSTRTHSKYSSFGFA